MANNQYQKKCVCVRISWTFNKKNRTSITRLNDARIFSSQNTVWFMTPTFRWQYKFNDSDVVYIWLWCFVAAAAVFASVQYVSELSRSHHIWKKNWLSLVYYIFSIILSFLFFLLCSFYLRPFLYYMYMIVCTCINNNNTNSIVLLVSLLLLLFSSQREHQLWYTQFYRIFKLFLPLC